MKTPSHPEITDELLSAYIDNAVSDHERALVETAVNENASVAWRLATLRETVNLLRAMPVLQAPRPFVLTPQQVGQQVREPALVPGVLVADSRRTPETRPSAPARPGRWAELLERWRGFWQAGSPVWRNAMATSMALLLVMIVAPAFLGYSGQPEQMAAPAVMVREAAPAAEALESSEMQPSAKNSEPFAFSAPEVAPSAPEVAPVEEPAAPAVRIAVQEDIAEAVPTVQATALALTEPVIEEAVIASAALAQSSGAAEALIMAPPAREDDPLNPQPPEEEVAGAGFGVSAADMMPIAPASAAPGQEMVLQAPSGALAEEPAMQSTGVPMATEQVAEMDFAMPTADSDGIDSEGIVPAPVAVAVSTAATEPATAQDAEIAPTTVARAASSERQAEARTGAAAPPVRDVAAVEPAQLLPWFQLALVGAVIVFGLLWQRSRRSH